MTVLKTQTFDQVVQAEAAAVQGGVTSGLVDFSVGSILRTFAESVAAIVMWLQGLILQLLTTTRAATSTGSDLDSWIADYGLTRLGAATSGGSVTFSRFTPTLQAIVPTGSIIQTADGTQQFQVIADAAQSAYVAGTGYVLPAATASITATVAALAPGAGGNVAIGVLNTLGQTISGVDTVTNTLAFSTGTNAESDAALRLRFVNYLSSLSKATSAAIGNAIASLQLGITYTLTEDYSYGGAYQPGYFYLVIDDGTGSPPTSIVNAVTAAVNAVRGCGIQFNVFAPIVVTANIAVTVTAAAPYTHTAIAAALQPAIAAYVAALPLGVSLSLTRLYQIIYDATPGIASVSGLTINGAGADIAATAQQAIIPGTVIIS
jgi:uncharacterized phage protein gp47/JayE